MPILPADPPAPFSLPVIGCPACGHGIDPHGLNPGGPCGVGGRGRQMPGAPAPCPCLWSPNDIAGRLIGVLRAQLHTRTNDLIAREF